MKGEERKDEGSSRERRTSEEICPCSNHFMLSRSHHDKDTNLSWVGDKNWTPNHLALELCVLSVLTAKPKLKKKKTLNPQVESVVWRKGPFSKAPVKTMAVETGGPGF